MHASQLTLPREMEHVSTTADLQDWLRRCYRHAWMVHVEVCKGATIVVAGHSDVTWTMIATPLRYDLHGPSP